VVAPSLIQFHRTTVPPRGRLLDQLWFGELLGVEADRTDRKVPRAVVQGPSRSARGGRPSHAVPAFAPSKASRTAFLARNITGGRQDSAATTAISIATAILSASVRPVDRLITDWPCHGLLRDIERSTDRIALRFDTEARQGHVGGIPQNYRVVVPGRRGTGPCAMGDGRAGQGVDGTAARSGRLNAPAHSACLTTTIPARGIWFIVKRPREWAVIMAEGRRLGQRLSR
jgi:hypothetical protein